MKLQSPSVTGMQLHQQNCTIGGAVEALAEMVCCCVQAEVEHAKQSLYRLQQEMFARAQAAEANERERAADAAAEQAAQGARRAQEAAIADARRQEMQQRARRVRLASLNSSSTCLLGSLESIRSHPEPRIIDHGVQECFEWGQLIIRYACKGSKACMWPCKGRRKACWSCSKLKESLYCPGGRCGGDSAASPC